ncbi:MAG: polyketide synthase, partial [Caulobacterales bacterium]|nr:polyketide synthase [Caulobacterales bacterium]
MAFEPIAIVGRACVLPGALSPDALWRAVAEGRDLVTGPPPGAERVEPARAGAAGSQFAIAWRAAAQRGGHVTGFDGVFDPGGFRLPADEVRRLDPLFQWVLHTGREAWRDAGGEGRLAGERCAVVLGNLSYPSRALVALAAEAALDAQPWSGPASRGGVTAPENRFMSGYPAHLLARALGLGGPAFALDAACASSFYALGAACDMLHDRSIDAAVVGAVNRSDNLFLHLGFSALNALSPSGKSRPFDRAADGLLPSEGAAAIVIKRACDVDPAHERVYGVVRGLGLSNDGRRKGLLAPDPGGQREAMARAYASADIDPATISLIECHATGTPVGDPIEARNLRDLFAAAPDLPIGSLKSNVGHLITVAGLASLIKVLGALEQGERPPMRAAGDPIDEAREGPLRILSAPEPWTVDGPRRAGLSAFGFGGDNAHLILEEWS